MIVLVPTYNRPHLFSRLVDDLARELTPEDPFFVVDDCSTNGGGVDASLHIGMMLSNVRRWLECLQQSHMSWLTSRREKAPPDLAH